MAKVELTYGTDYGKILRRIRKDSGMTLASLGKRCGIPWRTIQDFERGRHTPSINRVEKMLASLGCSIVLHRKPIIRSLDQKMEELYPFLSVRVVNFLHNSDVVTVGDLTSKTWLDIIRAPNFGWKSLKEIEELLGKAGLALKHHEIQPYPSYFRTNFKTKAVKAWEEDLNDTRVHRT